MFHIDTTVAIAIVVAVAVLSIAALVISSKGGAEAENYQADELLRQGHLEKQKGNYVQMEYVLLKALEIFGSGTGGDFTKKSSCMVNLMECYSQQGKAKEAREMSERMLNYWRGVLAHPSDSLLKDVDYFVATSDFGSATRDVSDCYNTVIELKKKMFGPMHHEVADSLMLQSLLMSKLGERAQADELEAESKAMRSGIAGGPSSRTHSLTNSGGIDESSSAVDESSMGTDGLSSAVDEPSMGTGGPSSADGPSSGMGGSGSRMDGPNA